VSQEITIGAGDDPRCDFCSDPRIFARYPAKDFAVKHVSGPNVASRGDWAACKRCTELIEAAKWDELLERSIATFRVKYGGMIPPDILRRFITDLHLLFRQNRQPLH
jgi:hypothetical protein